MKGLSKISNNDIRNNKIRAVIAYALRTAAALCATGTLMQTFLEVAGFSQTQNYIHTTLLQAANVLTIVLCSRWGDKGNIFRRCGTVLILNGLLFMFYIPVCFSSSAVLEAYILLIGVGVMQQITTALSTVCEYKIPYFIYKADEYGTVMAVSGVASAILSFGVSTLIAALSARYDYKVIMIFAFSVSSLFVVISGALHIYQKSLIDMDSVQETKETGTKVPIKEVFLHPVFAKLFLPNLARGFASGTVNVLAIVAFDLGYDQTVTTVMASLFSISTFVACTVFGIVSIRISPRISTFAGSLSFLLLPLIFTGNRWLFLCAYTIIVFGRTLIDYAVPAVLLKAVPVEIAGPYNAWRMILHNGGTLIATTVASFIPPIALCIITTILQVYSGICFLRSKELRKSSPAIIKSGN